MTQVSTTEPPSFLATAVSGLVRHLATYGAGALVAYGVISQKQTTEVTDIALSAGAWLLAVGWSMWEKNRQAKAQ